MPAKEELTNRDASAPQAGARRRCRAAWALLSIWGLNVAALVAFVALAYVNGRFHATFLMLKTEVQLFLSSGRLAWHPDTAGPLSMMLRILLGIAAMSGMAIFAGLFLGPERHRRVRSWLAFVALVAVWLAAWSNWQEIFWLGQQRRLKADLAAFETAAASLRQDWPAVDGERPLVGPFMAYPIGRPTLLMLLMSPELPTSRIQVAAVERTPDGGLSFQLSGAETGAWIEWHPAGSRPADFTGGLMTDYRLERSAPIGTGWHLVRYRVSSLGR